MIPKHRPPTAPGEMLLEEFLVPMGMTQRALAEELSVSVQTVNLIVKGKRGITAEMAVRLSRVFKNSPQFWLGLQMDYELDLEMDRLGDRLSKEVGEFSKAS